MKHTITLFSALLLCHLCLAQDGQLVIDELSIDTSAQAMDDKVFAIVEVMPKYPGGDQALMDWIAAEVSYPAEAKEQQVEGMVFVRFIIGTDGSIGSAEVISGVHPLLDAEALRVVNGIKGFSPGLQRGKPVRVQYIAPIAFRL